MTAQINTIPYDSAIAVRVCRYVLNHIHEKIKLDDLADSLKINPSYLSRTFKQKTGITIFFYISKAKVDEAKRLLRNTDIPISNISNYLGFSGQHYFQSVFKKYTGTTPKSYRDIQYI